MTAPGRKARVRPLFERAPRERDKGEVRLAPTLGGERPFAPRPRPLFEGPADPATSAPREAEPAPAPRREVASLFEGDEAELAPSPAMGGAPAPGAAALAPGELIDGAQDSAPSPLTAQSPLLAPAPMIDPYEELRGAQAEAEAARDRYLAALRELERVHAADWSNLEDDLADVALEIARALLFRELQTDRLYVVRLVEAALKVTVEDEAASVLVSPQDLARVEQERTRLEVARGGGLIRVNADPALHPGDCLVQVGRARIDARLPDRLERVRQALHGVVTETE